HLSSIYLDAETTQLNPLSLHDALPICRDPRDEPRRHLDQAGGGRGYGAEITRAHLAHLPRAGVERLDAGPVVARAALQADRPPADRKSTRLNSSHVKNSYAVFCMIKRA